MGDEPDLKALRALTIVAEENSLSAAGARLGVSQQAVSLRIRGLERQLRLRLLVRSARGSRLTPAGELIVGWATTLLAAVDEFSDATASLRSDHAKRMRIAASLTLAEHLLPDWIARWRDAVGDAGPVAQLTAANSSAVVEAVREGAADLGFIEAPTLPTDLGSAVVAHDTIEVVVRRGHRWARRARVSLRELSATGLVLREAGSGTRQALEDALAEAGHPLAAEPAAVASTTLGVRSAVMGGVGPGALSSLAVSEDVRAGRLVRVPVEGLRISRPLTALWSGKAPYRAVREFLESVPREA
ncbi:LysR family transcriptional regulator [Streptomyces sp. NPDC005438]|uniref:LysR family transcriptional regulator n=1 Tax=Streptomyces sp. NPDC005438 TaxID=3156880 RepID=UPI0033A7A1BE